MSTGPTFVAKGTTASGVGALTVSMPAGFVAGDILVLMLETAAQFVADPSGWTTFGFIGGIGAAGGTSATASQLWWKRAAGSELTVAIGDSGDHQVAAVSAYRGCVASGSPIGQTGGSDSSAVTNKAMPAASSLTAHSLVVAFATCSLGTNTTVGLASPGGDWAVRSTFTTTAGNGGTFGYADFHPSTPTLSASWTSATPDSGSQSIEIGFFELLPLPSETITLAGTMQKLTGSVAVSNKESMTFSGTMQKLTGSIVASPGVAPTITHALAGTMQKLTGSIAETQKTPLVISGTMQKLTGSITESHKLGLAIGGTMQKLIASVAVLNRYTLTLAGTLAQVTAAVSVGTTLGASITGTMQKLTGSIVGPQKVSLSLSGSMQKLTGDIVASPHLGIVLGGTHQQVTADLTATPAGGGALLVGLMQKLTGSVAAGTTLSVTISGVLLPLAASVVAQVKLGAALDGTMQKLTGAIVAPTKMAPITFDGVVHGPRGSIRFAQPLCYQVIDDTRERILARLAVVLSGVAPYFGRNDVSLPETQLPKITLLDADEDSRKDTFDRGRPGYGPNLIGLNPEIYVTVSADDGEQAGAMLVDKQRAIIDAVVNDAQLIALVHNNQIEYASSEVGIRQGRTTIGQMTMEFTFWYKLQTEIPCVPPDIVVPDAPVREAILDVLSQIIQQAEGVKAFQRNDLTVPDDESTLPRVILLDGPEIADTRAWGRGRPANAPNRVIMTPEIYIVAEEDASRAGPTLNRIRLMILRGILTDPVLARLAMDHDIRYEGCQTAMAAGRGMTGEMGISISIARVERPSS